MDFRIEIAIGRRDDAHVEIAGLGRPDSADFAVLEGAQELRLQGERQVGDFIEQQHTAVRRFEQSRLGAIRPAEGALLVTKQLRLEQLLRQRAAIHRHECAAPGGLMNGPRDQLLARSALPGDQHGVP